MMDLARRVQIEQLAEDAGGEEVRRALTELLTALDGERAQCVSRLRARLTELRGQRRDTFLQGFCAAIETLETLEAAS